MIRNKFRLTWCAHLWSDRMLTQLHRHLAIPRLQVCRAGKPAAEMYFVNFVPNPGPRLTYFPPVRGTGCAFFCLLSSPFTWLPFYFPPLQKVTLARMLPGPVVGTVKGTRSHRGWGRGATPRTAVVKGRGWLLVCIVDMSRVHQEVWEQRLLLLNFWDCASFVSAWCLSKQKAGYSKCLPNLHLSRTQTVVSAHLLDTSKLTDVYHLQ